MKIIRTVKEFKEERAKIGADKSVGFVPTMGGLHEGHMSLVQKCRENNDVTVVSVYLNPTQFNDKNDLNTYPANFDDDKALLEKNGCDILLWRKGLPAICSFARNDKGFFHGHKHRSVSDRPPGGRPCDKFPQQKA